ncbi:hypothetical protein GB931_19390 [Modestobacter sp. I12A-02628]|uniref:Uncharacterized protein n=1 Tax=Goekera deserti TaxID=2497753 RepID=A0A7K3WFC0_9ACTN|nr:hypothetical protein [Goekera deserti]MPR00044.1 hypothetical protein [Goekera deserti]NDI49823.1 hypothetical protein [Goekera deserti]NEL55185.1 hypothetical protein [Goekera deserti]
MIAAIIACEIGFWVVLGAGLLARYVLRRPRLGAALLVCVPLVDVVLLVLTAVDLGRGAEPESAHGLAALYLGFSVAFGHDMVRWADVRVAHRFAGGPPPAPRPPAGSPARQALEWRSFRLALLAAAVAATVLGGLLLVVPDGTDTTALRDFFPVLGVVLAVWLVTGPLWTARRRPVPTP